MFFALMRKIAPGLPNGKNESGFAAYISQSETRFPEHKKGRPNGRP
jgi:hypothetical protein